MFIDFFVQTNLFNMPTPHILVVAGTNRKGSLTAQVAQYYATLLHKKGLDHQVLDLINLPKDFTVSALYDNMGQDKAFNALKAPIEAASKYVFIIPEYNGSFPGIFKAFIDGLPFPHTFKGKKCALVGLSKGPRGGVCALSHLTDIFHYLKMSVYPLSPTLSNIKDSKLATILSNKTYVQLLEEQVAGIIDF